MANKYLVHDLRIDWEIENYTYSHSFSLDRIGFYVSSKSRNGTELKRPDFLYKFYGKTDYNLDSLSKGYLFFSNPRNFNDPFDCLTNREEIILKGGKDIIKHRDNIGVCCFSLTNRSPLMWGHYTNNYNGFCLKFKNDSLFTSRYIPIKTHVSYLKNYQPANQNLRNAISKLKATNINDGAKDNIHKILKMFFEYSWKYYDWKYEKEFRAISWTTNEFKRKFEYNKDDVKSIYIGHKMKETDPAYYDLLIEVLRSQYSNIKIYEVKPNQLVVKLDFYEIIK
jgi:hypothetical protein